MWPFNRNSQPLITDDHFRELISQAMTELETKTMALDALIHFAETDWNADLELGTITFTSETGITATAPVQVVGTYNLNDNTFLWGWDHPSVPEPIANHAQAVLKYGEEHRLVPLTERKIECTDADCWEFTALACKLNEAQGAYRGALEGTLVFMTFGTVKMSSAGQIQ